MALPKLNIINHSLILPSTGKELTYRPFLVKEEKMLMMAMESGETKDVIRATRDIIESCVQDDININHLPMFDVEYIFLQLRAKSVGDVTTISFSLGDEDKCSKDEDKHCIYSTEIEFFMMFELSFIIVTSLYSLEIVLLKFFLILTFNFSAFSIFFF